ncbi:hypothetical protein RUE5091_03185 [Ruegeria denitrificans]|uniref:Uncharacterized protein n=1 Tax=Ruegeria denitrificans TaxID=1715692 RepID=A0A0P1IVD4_9RHOB|nr:hypothetical protein RUE5091_03185 [Ruegeria denitrificans]
MSGNRTTIGAMVHYLTSIVGFPRYHNVWYDPIEGVNRDFASAIFWMSAPRQLIAGADGASTWAKVNDPENKFAKSRN